MNINQSLKHQIYHRESVSPAAVRQNDSLRLPRLRSKLIAVALPGLLLLLAGCAGSRTATKTPSPRPLTAAGVDSSIIAESDSIARALFVSWENQQRAQQQTTAGEASLAKSTVFWEALEGKPATQPTPQDTLQAVGKFNQGAGQLIAMQKLSTQGLTPEQLRRRSQTCLDSARVYFEAALQLNPYDSNTRLWLARSYQLLAERFLSDQHLRQAAVVLDNLLRMDRGQHGIYGRLGQVYLSLKEWQKSLFYFQQAETVLRQTSIFNIAEGKPLSEQAIAAATDSSAWFLYVFYQSESQIRLHAADSALAALERGRSLARTAEELGNVQSTIDWINWDDGNIQAVEFRDNLIDLVAQERYREAAAGYNGLKARLRTARAKRETDWRLAILEYAHLDQRDAALTRLAEVVKFYGSDSLPADTMAFSYRNSFGTMCHNQGLEALKKKDFRRALAYFRQSAAVPWEQVARSHIEIAKLSINDPKQAVHHAELALRERDLLDNRDKQDVMRIMVAGLKRLGRFAEATDYYRQYRALADGQP